MGSVVGAAGGVELAGIIESDVGTGADEASTGGDSPARLFEGLLGVLLEKNCLPSYLTCMGSLLSDVILCYVQCHVDTQSVFLDQRDGRPLI